LLDDAATEARIAAENALPDTYRGLGGGEGGGGDDLGRGLGGGE
jgi:hypothetical protein